MGQTLNTPAETTNDKQTPAFRPHAEDFVRCTDYNRATPQEMGLLYRLALEGPSEGRPNVTYYWKRLGVDRTDQIMRSIQGKTSLIRADERNGLVTDYGKALGYSSPVNVGNPAVQDKLSKGPHWVSGSDFTHRDLTEPTVQVKEAQARRDADRKEHNLGKAAPILKYDITMGNIAAAVNNRYDNTLATYNEATLAKLGYKPRLPSQQDSYVYQG